MIYVYDESKFNNYISEIADISGNIKTLSSDFSSAFSSCKITKIIAAANSIVEMMNAMNGNWKHTEMMFNDIKETYKNSENALITGSFSRVNTLMNICFNEKQWELPDYDDLVKAQIDTTGTYKSNNISNANKPITIKDVIKNGWIATTKQNAKDGKYVKGKIREEMFEGATIREDGLIISKDGKTALGWTKANTVNVDQLEEKVDKAKTVKDDDSYKNEKYQHPNSGETYTKQETEKAVNNELGNEVVNDAVQYVGNPYVYGGSSLTKGIDCSGFTMKIYEKYGVKLPHSSSAQRNCGTAVASLKEAKPGDLICYSGHVAIYMGDNKIVHASNPETGIKISTNASYRPIVAIRRIIT